MKTKDVSVTNSLEVARVFDKRHDCLLRTIEEVLYKAEVTADKAVNPLNMSEHFFKVKYVADNGQTYKAYEMTEEGFMFLVLGFTGTKAFRVKTGFARTFFKMRDMLMENMAGQIAELQNELDEVTTFQEELAHSTDFVYISKTIN